VGTTAEVDFFTSCDVRGFPVCCPATGYEYERNDDGYEYECNNDHVLRGVGCTGFGRSG
jgi:hypothetical protein